MSATAAARDRVVPLALGLGVLVFVIAAVELLIRIDVINRFIVPMPSQIAASFERVILEEDIFGRFRLTFFEAFTAGAMITVVGVAIGLLLYRVNLLRLATETWVAAIAVWRFAHIEQRWSMAPTAAGGTAELRANAEARERLESGSAR